MTQYNSETFAKYLLALASKHNVSMNITKLHKLLYAIYGFYFAIHDKKIIDETPKAWPYGPVFPKVHDHVDMDEIYSLNSLLFKELNQDKEINDIILQVFNKMGDWSATKLVNWSHEPGTPWNKTVTAPEWTGWNSPISDKEIKKHFEAQTVYS